MKPREQHKPRDRGPFEESLGWKSCIPDLGDRIVYVKVEASEILIRGRDLYRVVFDEIEISEANGTIYARRNGHLVALLRAEKT